jgi:homoserine O-acetyltransferase
MSPTQNQRYPDLNAFLREHWEAPFLTRWDANDLITLLDTWQTGDVTGIHGDPDLQTALGRIKAKGLMVPCKTDLYFPVSKKESHSVVQL